MAGKQVPLVNEVPFAPVKVKVEPLSDEEDTVACRVCSKSFASDMALRNHVRMEHFETFEQGDPNLWTAVCEGASQSKKKKLSKPPKSKKEKDMEQIKMKTEQILSTMPLTTGNLISLVSYDVKYIIMKDEPQETPAEPPERRRRVRLMKVNQPPRDVRKKEPTPITGLFECVQPSNIVADGVCHQMFFSCCEYSLHYRDEHTRRRKGLRCQVCEKPLTQVAVQNCRKRKLDQITSLADEVRTVRARKLRTRRGRRCLRAERQRLKERCAALYRHVFQNLRDPEGRPLSSAQYSLQQAADGDVVLVPKMPHHTDHPMNSTSDDEMDRKPKNYDL